MKGLIKRDFYCLRKELKTFLGVTIGVMVISVLFVLSTRYGNIANAMKEVQAEGQLEADFLYSYLKVLILVTLFIPMAFIGNVTDCFKEDRRAGFSKVLLSMPVTNRQIVGSRYLTCILFAGVSLCASLLCAVCVSIASPDLLLGELISSTMSFCAFFLIYMSLVLFLLYLWGAEKADYIQVIPFAAVGAVILITYMNKILSASGDEFEKLGIEMMEGLKRFSQEKYAVLFLLAILCFAVSFFASVKVMERKREVL